MECKILCLCVAQSICLFLHAICLKCCFFVWFFFLCHCFHCFAAMVLKLQSLIYGQWRQIGMSKWMREQSTIPYMMRCIFPSWLTNATLMRAIIFLKLNNRMFEDDIFHLYFFCFFVSITLKLGTAYFIQSILVSILYGHEHQTDEIKCVLYFVLFNQYHIHIYY